MEVVRTLELFICPTCGRKLNVGINFGGRAVPKPGDLAICVYCATKLVVNSGRKFEVASAEVLEVYRKADPVKYEEFERFSKALQVRCRRSESQA